MKQLLFTLAAAGISTMLWWLGTGLHPVPVVVMFAPLPVLLVAPRIPAWMAFAAGFVSWPAGAYGYIPYFTSTLEQPPLATVVLLGITATTYAALIALTRILIRRGRLAAAVLALPAGWVTMEYLISLRAPFGAWWSLAYTQVKVLPLIQVASLTGWLGVSFLVMLVPATAAVLLATGAPRLPRIRCAAAAFIVLIVVFGFGFWRLSQPAGEAPVQVGVLAVAQPDDYVPVDSADGRDMITRVVAEVDRLADRGARIVVLPEKSWRATDSTLPALSGPLTEVATRRGVHVIAGLLLTRGATTTNVAIDYPTGTVYAKHHLVPGLEADLTPGTGVQQIPGTSWALAVCFDLDFPDLLRANRTAGATMLLVPALDFGDDHWLHSRMAVLHAVESGLALARPAQLGDLVLSDAQGRTLASITTNIATTHSALAALPQPTTPTLYSRLGDWPARPAALLLAFTLLSAFRRPNSRTNAPAHQTNPVAAR
ncbi:nitrilase-related carbon-nitrogen hydrolase [Nocardia sp. NPDC020380]|uniref:nitrilase-related carbon-nitrogen hydrolase n=1 Tax=Nocardia sp. NPDC020380 TaxID=3364309 RepID=UPI0037B76DD8